MAGAAAAAFTSLTNSAPGPDSLPGPAGAVARSAWRDQLIVTGYRSGARVAQMLPERVALGGGRMIGAMVPLVARKRAAQVAAHQRRIDPSLVHGGARLRRQVRRTFGSYGCSFVDSFRLATVGDRLEDRFTVVGRRHIDAGLAAGNGVIMAMPHVGPWDYGGAWLARNYPLTVVAEALEPPGLSAWFGEHRRRMGITVVPLGPDAGVALLRALKANEVVGLLCDRDIAGGGVPVEFFGERTTMPAGPATFALRTGAAVLPNVVVYTGGNQMRGIICAPIAAERTGRLREDVARMTQLIATSFEGLIRRFPEQYHVLVPVWPSDPRR